MPRHTTRSSGAERAKDAANKRRRSALKRRPISDELCRVPGCESFALMGEDGHETDCCYRHSLLGSDTDASLANEGIIDWIAIEIAAQGARPVRLTWVEKDIVMARVLASGGTITQAIERAGVHHQGAAKGRRSRDVPKIVQAFEATRSQEEG